jgi:hypothetical protein
MSGVIMHKSVLLLPLALFFGACSTMGPNFKNADVNHDRKLSKQEFTDGVVEVMFPKYDTNGDGVVVLAEWQAAEGKGNNKFFSDRDLNKDGKVTKAEARKSASNGPRLAALFTEVDVNADGYITVTEIEAYKKAHPKPKS